MKLLRLLSLSLLFALPSLAAASEGPRDPYKFFFQDTFGDFREELQLARDEGKQGVLIFFEMDECPFCHYMKQYVLNQPEVQDYYREHFRIFAVDIEGDIEITDFQGQHTTQKDFAFKQNQVRATPVFAFFDLDGNRYARYTGRTTGVEEFLWLGEYVTGDAHTQMRFEQFKRDKRKERSGQ